MWGRLSRADRRWVAGGLLAGVLVVAGLAGPWGFAMLDLDVYRVGGSAVLHGTDLYGVTEPETGYPFTYPVFAGLLFVPLAVLPVLAARVALTLLSVTALFVIMHLTTRRLSWSVPLSVLAVGLHPVWETFTFAQVNLILTALVLVDVLSPDRRWRGVLVGIATGIKLVPGLFVVYFLVTGQRRAAGVAALTTLATMAVGFAVQPGPSWVFWTHHALNPARTGSPAYVTNQSVLGVAARLLRTEEPPGWLTLGVSAIVVVAALVLARRLLLRGETLTSVCVVAVASLLASPISWSHHWVWAIPCLGTLAVWAHGARWRWWVFGIATAIVATGPMQFLPKEQVRELDHTFPQQVVASVYAWLAVAYLLWAWVRVRRTGSPTTSPPP